MTSGDDMLEIVLLLRAGLACLDDHLFKPSLWQTDDSDALKSVVVHVLFELWGAMQARFFPTLNFTCRSLFYLSSHHST